MAYGARDQGDEEYASHMTADQAVASAMIMSVPLTFAKIAFRSHLYPPIRGENQTDNTPCQ